MEKKYRLSQTLQYSYGSPHKNPCKDCKDRKVGCHSKCEKYKSFREDLEAKNKKARLEKFGNEDTSGWLNIIPRKRKKPR